MRGLYQELRRIIILCDPSITYNVRQKRCNWFCDCPDYLHRRAQCKHILAVMDHVVEQEELELGTHECAGAGQGEEPDIHIEEVPEYPQKCIETRIVKWGFTGKDECRRQRYKCKNPECGCTFVCRGGFERMRKPIWAILRTFNDFFKGHTPEEIADT